MDQRSGKGNLYTLRQYATDVISTWDDSDSQAIADLGFCTHVIDLGDGIVDYHTHGLEQTKQHPDLQIVLKVAPETACQIFANIVDRINAGDVFRANARVSGIIEGYDVQFIRVRESSRSVLRVILPDIRGRFPEDEDCSPLFRIQEKLAFL